MTHKNTLNLLLLALLFTACQPNDSSIDATALDVELEEVLNTISDGQGKGFFKLPTSDDFDNIPQDPKNPLTKEKVKLGQLLFHETGLANAPKKEGVGEGQYSCASCHFASAGFQAGRFQGIAEGGMGFGHNGGGRKLDPMYEENELDVQPLRTPTAMHGAYQKNLLWNGQFGATGTNEGTEHLWKEGTPIATNKLGLEGLEIQAIAGLEVHRLKINDDFLNLRSSEGEMKTYREMFEDAFPNFMVLPAGYDRERVMAGLAIAAYERTILANQAPFQKWLAGDYLALSEDEKRGAVLFFGKADCGTCHTGPALNSMEFHALGFSDLQDCPEEVFETPADSPAHKGRGGFTGEQADMYKFKVPQLYNLADSPFYGHGSSFRTIQEVVEYKNNAVTQNDHVQKDQLASDFKALNLSHKEIEDITTFLKYSLKDVDLARYEPKEVHSGQCFPNNDLLSRADLGCD